MKYLVYMLLLFLLAGCSSIAGPDKKTIQAQALQTVRFGAVSYTTTKGATGGQAVSVLHLKDQSGTQNNWNRYLEFQTPGVNYSGYRSYTLPSTINPQHLNSLKVNLNFLGPGPVQQTWTWHIYNWSSKSWVRLGNNTGASWAAWKPLSFNASGTLSNYVKANTREIRIRTNSNNASDDADLDYEAVEITYETANTDSWWKPAKGLRWWWQIENTSNLNTSLSVDVYDIDLFEGVDSGKISTLKTKGYKVICYFSAGTYEPWRPDATQLFANNGQAIIAGSSLPQFSDEAWLKIGNIQALENIIKPVMQARLDLAKNAGCDAVEPDNVDGYENSETQGQITKTKQVSYNKWLASEAHSRGLGVGLKNALGLISQLQNDFDFAVNEQCYAYGNECSVYESSFLTANKAVFNQEYQYSPNDGGSISKTPYNTKACPYFRSTSISSLWKSGLNLNGNAVVSCNP